MPLYLPPASEAALGEQDLIEYLGSYMAGQYSAVQARLIEQMATRVRKGLNTLSTQQRLAAISQLREDAAKALRGINTPELAHHIVAIAQAEGEAAAVKQIDFARGLGARYFATSAGGNIATGLTSQNAYAAAQIGLSLTSTLQQVNQRILRAVPDVYQQTVAKAVGNRILGGITGRVARSQAVTDFLSQGITGFVDTAGRNWSIGAYTEMATRTAANRAWIGANLDTYAKLDLHLVTIVAAPDCCKYCAAWAGRILSTDGEIGPRTVTNTKTGQPMQIVVFGSLDDARAAGWNHPNCRCTVEAVFPGLGLPQLTSLFDPQGSDDRDKLRGLERNVRGLKLKQAAASGDAVQVARFNAPIRDAQAKIRQHVEDTGQLRKPYREQLTFQTGKPTLPALPAPRAVLPEPAPAPLPSVAPPRALTPPARITPPKPPTVPRTGVPKLSELPPPKPITVPKAPDGAPVPPERPAPGGTMAARYEYATKYREYERAKIDYDVAQVKLGAAAPRTAVERNAAIDTAQSGADVGKILARELQHRGITVKGFTNNVAIDTARLYAKTILDLLDRYPEMRLQVVGFERMSARSYAHVRAADQTGMVELTMNPTYGNDRAAFLKHLENDVTSTHHPEGFTDVDAIIAHEFGHVVDANADWAISAGARARLEEYARELGLKVNSSDYAKWVRDNLPGYSRVKGGSVLNPREALAEAFADVWINGDAATAVSKALTKGMIERGKP